MTSGEPATPPSLESFAAHPPHPRSIRPPRTHRPLTPPGSRPEEHKDWYGAQFLKSSRCLGRLGEDPRSIRAGAAHKCLKSKVKNTQVFDDFDVSPPGCRPGEHKGGVQCTKPYAARVKTRGALGPRATHHALRRPGAGGEADWALLEGRGSGLSWLALTPPGCGPGEHKGPVQCTRPYAARVRTRVT